MCRTEGNHRVRGYSTCARKSTSCSLTHKISCKTHTSSASNSTQMSCSTKPFLYLQHDLLVIQEACDKPGVIDEAAVSHQHAHNTWHLNKAKLGVLCPVASLLWAWHIPAWLASKVPCSVCMLTRNSCLFYHFDHLYSDCSLCSGSAACTLVWYSLIQVNLWGM